MFHVPFDTEIYGVAGNHDVGFHYAMNPILIDRFDRIFNNTDNSLISIRGNHFIFINSMSMEQDGCDFCIEAEENLRKIAKQFKCAQGLGSCKNIEKLSQYSRPIIMQVGFKLLVLKYFEKLIIQGNIITTSSTFQHIENQIKIALSMIM